MKHDLRVLALHKGAERYVYVYEDNSLTTLLDELRNQAADPRLSLSWFDASVLTGRANKHATEPTVQQSDAA